MNPSVPLPSASAQAALHPERWIDDELRQSFPASDPPSWTLGATAVPEAQQQPAPAARSTR